MQVVAVAGADHAEEILRKEYSWYYDIRKFIHDQTSSSFSDLRLAKKQS